MAKLVVLKLIGDFEQGFQANLAIATEGQYPTTEITGNLPPAPHLNAQYQRWRSLYHRSVLFDRAIAPQRITYDGSLAARQRDCQAAAQELHQMLNDWLTANTFRKIERKCLELLNPADEVRVVIQSACRDLLRLPWHLWDWIDGYQNVEVALRSLQTATVTPDRRPRQGKGVRILSILGDSQQIEVNQDRQLLEQLPGTELMTLVEPQHRDINDHLWEQSWDILFFAGHGRTQDDEGRIYINPDEHLTLKELKYGLQKAIARGLQIAIFNACDGLGLAWDLDDVPIPHLIVMREPVPDRVAQAFLDYFLQGYAEGRSLPLAIREARERLQGLEKDYVCASWLPVTFRHPAIAPPTWQGLGGKQRQPLPNGGDSQQRTYRPPKGQNPAPIAAPSLQQDSPPLSPRRGLGISLGAAVVVVGLRLLGLLQGIELQAFDTLMRSRPAEAPDPRLLVVMATETDLQQHGAPLPDGIIAEAIAQLQSHEPHLIGLNMFRERPRQPGHGELQTALQAENAIAICSLSEADNPNKPGIAPPATVPVPHQGFSDVIPDDDRVLRRQLLFAQPDIHDPCQTKYSFSARLALRYLHNQKVEMKTLTPNRTQLGPTVIERLSPNSGAYHHLDNRGVQILINYRAGPVAPTVALADLLAGNVDPALIRDRIVLLGISAPLSQSTASFLTPYSAQTKPYQEMPGVMIHAHMTSQLLAAVLDGRSLLWVLPELAEIAWITLWAILGGWIGGGRFSRGEASPTRWGVVVALGGGIVLLTVICWLVLLQGGWLPWISAGLVLWMSAGGNIVYQRQGRS